MATATSGLPPIAVCALHHRGEGRAGRSDVMERDRPTTSSRRRGVAPARATSSLGGRGTVLPRKIFALLALGALVWAAGVLMREQIADPEVVPAPPPRSILAEGLAGPPTRAAAQYEAQHRRAATVEEYEAARAARF